MSAGNRVKPVSFSVFDPEIENTHHMLACKHKLKILLQNCDCINW